LHIEAKRLFSDKNVVKNAAKKMAKRMEANKGNY
jgi:hypothetical protein